MYQDGEYGSSGPHDLMERNGHHAQRYIGHSDIDGEESGEGEELRLLRGIELSEGEVAALLEDEATEGSETGMNTRQQPWEFELDCLDQCLASVS